MTRHWIWHAWRGLDFYALRRQEQEQTNEQQRKTRPTLPHPTTPQLKPSQADSIQNNTTQITLHQAQTQSIPWLSSWLDLQIPLNKLEHVSIIWNKLERVGPKTGSTYELLCLVVLSCAWHRPSRKALRWPSRSSLLRWTGSPQPATFRRKSGLDDGHVTCGQQKSRERATLINLTDVVGFKNTEARDRQPETIDGTGRWRQWRYLSWKEKNVRNVPWSHAIHRWPHNKHLQTTTFQNSYTWAHVSSRSG